MDKKHSTLILWFNNGTTAKFVDVKNYFMRAKTIDFDYYSQSELVARKASFLRDRIDGYALSER